VNEEKMSKSLGNFFTVREVLKQFAPEVLRYFILASHYRSPLDYTDHNLNAAKSALDGYYLALRGVVPALASAADESETRFHEAMQDDFNTPKAFAELSSLATRLNRAKAAGDTSGASRLAATLRRLGDVLGLLQQDPDEYFKKSVILSLAPGSVSIEGQASKVEITSSAISAAQVEALIERRTEARKRRDWPESDRIRDELRRAGVILEDGPAGTSWRRG
jgi:cysteinyl-tRNA synthetase